MKRLFPLHRILVPVFLLLFAASLYAQNGAIPRFNPPKQYYLALGDSLAFGMQQVKFNANLPSVPPSVFNTGYVDDFSLRLRGIRPHIQTINFGCPGEATITFINGGCPYTSVGFSLHNSYSGSQLSAALAFLQEHPGRVSPITINVGVNDLRPLLSICGSDLSCYEANAPAILAVTRANLDHILGSIRSVAPNAEIITFTNYDIASVLIDPRSARLAEAFNDVVSDTARSHSVRVADVFSAFNGGPQPATICSLTFACTPLQDTHPTDAGYATIASQIWAVSDYDRIKR
jgi:lysophospholipase L1-like esterase